MFIMRLINTKSLKLHEFFDSSTPPYANLSHRWEQDEVSYQDMLEGRKIDSAGCAKILKFCAIAMRDGYDWVWIDTCCIDKKSSAELSEAINSMFRWYGDSQLCYAYLSDVKVVKMEDGRVYWPDFPHSKWFTRGWTLQELIAPSDLIFIDCLREKIGERDDMTADISAVTEIPRELLLKQCCVGDFSVAQRMSWASKRKTSRVEDLAYYLLGLFDVKMPLLYGEGLSAFRNLQEEIIKTSSDETLFVWSFPHPYLIDEIDATLLATSPAFFDTCGKVKDIPYFWRKPYSITNKGLKIASSLYVDPQRQDESRLLIPLNYYLYADAYGVPTGLSGTQLAMIVRSYRLDTEHMGCSRLGWCKMPEDAEEVENSRKIYIR